MDILWVILGIALGSAATITVEVVRRTKAKNSLAQASAEAERVVAEARQEAQDIRKEAQIQAKDALIQSRSEIETEIRERRRELQQLDKRLLHREEALEKKAELAEKKEQELSQTESYVRARQKELEGKEGEYREVLEAARKQLERSAGMSREEAKKSLMNEMIDDATHESAKRIRQIEEDAKEEADRKAKKIITLALERLAGDFVAERSVTIMPLPNEEMKGRIIGKEGRNIRALEAATGVDLIIDDTPETVILSGHNPIRREIARIALERLISDGRIHPGRIEEVVKKAEAEVAESIREAGQKAVFDVGVHGLHPEIIKLLGRLKYRYSYAQNVLLHSIEAAFICGIMAAELGLNEKQARRAALLHDIGKAVDHEIEGSHAIIGAELARKYGESAKIVNAIAAHHEDVRAETILAPLVDASDALSGARPGARREVLETYIRRLEELERISSGFKGVEKSYAVQAGREIRIIVEHQNVTDDDAVVLAKEVARKIEHEITYPGQIKVTVIREMRAVDYAR